MKDLITLAHGAGGKEMDELIRSLNIKNRGNWKNYDDDSATLDQENNKLVFTTDSFIIDPIFFPGGNIGHIAFSGTVNDLLMMGANPLGISLSLILEEGFPISDLKKILISLNHLSEKTNIPIVTGDTKVMPKGKVDKIIINTSGIGTTETLLNKKAELGDKVIISGGLGEHAIALLSKRFDYETSIKTDSKPLVDEINSIKSLIKFAKDPTRGGIASTLNEVVNKHHVGILLDEESIPAKPEVRKVCDLSFSVPI